MVISIRKDPLPATSTVRDVVPGTVVLDTQWTAHTSKLTPYASIVKI
jgi:hypothetical protein